MDLLHAALFAASAAALWHGALRLASRTADGWARVAAAAVLSGVVAALVPLLLGAVSAGGSAWALSGLTLVFALSARIGRAGSPLALSGPRSAAQRRLVTLAAGAAAGALAWALIYPSVRSDAFHLVEVVRWLHGGVPGTVELTVQEWPAGSYPKVNELILTWALGISHSFVVVAFYSVALAALLGASAYGALRGLGVTTPVAALAALGICASLFTFSTFEGSGTDLPSLAWLAAAAALAVASRDDPRLAVPTVLAAALAVGTKSTTAPFAAVCVLLAIRHARPLTRRDTGLWAALALGAGLALAWPARNLIEHGSPFWPFARPAGVGDPLPYSLDHLQTTFAERPLATARVLWESDADNVVATLALLFSMAAAAVTSRHRTVVLLALLGGAGLVLWATSPITGKPRDFEGVWTTSILRYLMPVLCTAFAGVAVAARTDRRMRALLAADVGLFCVAALNMDWWGNRRVAAAMLVLGVIAAWILAGRRLPLPRRPAAATLWLCVPVTVLTFALAGHAAGRIPEIGYMGEAARWLHRDPRFEADRRPVVFNWRPDARFSGPGLRHDVLLLPSATSCADVRRRARTAWLVVWRDVLVSQPQLRPSPGERCLRGIRPAYVNQVFAVYAG